MSHLPDNERLLKDVLAEESAEGFREALLSETLRQARGRRNRRRASRVGGGLLLAIAATLLIWRNLPRQQSLQQQAVVPPVNYQLVQTQPLPATLSVETRPLSEAQLVNSFATANVIQTTSTSGRFREIGDGELLALAPGPAALVRRSPRQAEFFLLKATDDEQPQF